MKTYQGILTPRVMGSWPLLCDYTLLTLETKCSISFIDWLCWGLTTHQPLWVILCRLPEKGRKETEEIVEEVREENGTGMKVKKQKK